MCIVILHHTSIKLLSYYYLGVICFWKREVLFHHSSIRDGGVDTNNSQPNQTWWWWAKGISPMLSAEESQGTYIHTTINTTCACVFKVVGVGELF